MNQSLVLPLFVGASSLAAVVIVWRRAAMTSLLHLAQQIATDGTTTEEALPLHASALSLSDHLPLLGTLGGTVIACLAAFARPDSAAPCFVIGVSCGYLVGRCVQGRTAPDHDKSILFHLPIAVEKLLIGVQSGLDVVPALKSAITESTSGLDPASRELHRVVTLIEQGLTVESALEHVATQSKSIPLKHVLLHLKVAHHRGGDLTLPLRELADATQLTYEQSIEEEIAVLPIKATAPLLCTFLGLLIVFLTGPIIGVMISTQSQPNHQPISLTATSTGETR